MTDKTSRDVRLGDLSAIESTGAREPRLGSGEMSPADPSSTNRHRQRRELPDGPGNPPASMSSGRISWPLVVLAAVVLVLACVVVVLVMQQRTLSAALLQLDSKAQQSVEVLENRVASTNTTLKSTDSQTQRSLDLVASDIGRLDKTLVRLAQALEQEAKARSAVDADLRALATELRKTDQAGAQADAQQDARLKTLADALEQSGARLKAQSEAITRLERGGDTAQLRSEVAVLGASVRQLQDDHEKRLKSIEQTSGSNDAFRRQVNTTIDRLNQQVTELYQRR